MFSVESFPYFCFSSSILSFSTLTSFSRVLYRLSRSIFLTFSSAAVKGPLLFVVFISCWISCRAISAPVGSLAAMSGEYPTILPPKVERTMSLKSPPTMLPASTAWMHSPTFSSKDFEGGMASCRLEAPFGKASPMVQTSKLPSSLARMTSLTPLSMKSVACMAVIRDRREAALPPSPPVPALPSRSVMFMLCCIVDCVSMKSEAWPCSVPYINCRGSFTRRDTERSGIGL
mmetsp:Transcript_2445/g.5263  ORF Transcript_2445/g.5263 Transcript_2445/m.5263 type:complete len:231 (-) Transcript_2445:703-1395(-)